MEGPLGRKKTIFFGLPLVAQKFFSLPPAKKKRKKKELHPLQCNLTFLKNISKKPYLPVRQVE